MILTSNYTSRKITDAHAALRTSIGYPRFKLAFSLAGSVPELMPKREWLRLPRVEYETLYLAKLESIGVDAIRAAIDKAAAGRTPVLLCFCKLDEVEFCHRRLFASWWERNTGEVIQDL